jgi:hypothetical protein
MFIADESQDGCRGNAIDENEGLAPFNDIFVSLAPVPTLPFVVVHAPNLVRRGRYHASEAET